MPSTLTLVFSVTVILIPAGIGKRIGMRLAQAEVELVTLHGSLEADALDFQGL